MYRPNTHTVRTVTMDFRLGSGASSLPDVMSLFSNDSHPIGLLTNILLTPSSIHTVHTDWQYSM